MTDTPEDILKRLEEDELNDEEEFPEEEPTGEDPDGTCDTGVDEESDDDDDDSGSYHEKDWTGVPITLESTARIEEHPPNQYDGTTFTVFIDRHSGPGVSCGGVGGACFGAKTREEAIQKIKEDALNDAEWIISYGDPDDDTKTYKINRPVKIKLTIDGVKVDPWAKDLANFFETTEVK
jgi:hypothetical protein